MAYRVAEIFRSLQGEGFWTGTPAVFVRFSGCNLRCPFCDTAHASFRTLSAEEILDEITAAGGGPMVVLTGGEPGLQVDEKLINALHETGYRVHIETNGTVELPVGIDWVTLSPKEDVPELKGDGRVVLRRADEVKLVYAVSDDPEVAAAAIGRWAQFPAQWHFLQPCDEPDDPAQSRRNTEATVAYVLAHPVWRLSLQTHKYLNIQ